MKLVSAPEGVNVPTLPPLRTFVVVRQNLDPTKADFTEEVTVHAHDWGIGASGACTFMEFTLNPDARVKEEEIMPRVVRSFKEWEDLREVYTLPTLIATPTSLN